MTLPGTWTVPIHGSRPATSSVRVACAVTEVGRVCGTPIGMPCTPMVSRTSSSSTRPVTALMNRSQAMSGSAPSRSRNRVPAPSRTSCRTSRGSSYDTQWSASKIIAGRRDR